MRNKNNDYRQSQYKTILSFIRAEAARGQLYVPMQLSYVLYDLLPLCSTTLRKKIDELMFKGFIKLNRHERFFAHHPYGAVCIENMLVPTGNEEIDSETGETRRLMRLVLPTHEKDLCTGRIVPVKQPIVFASEETL